MHNMGTGGHPFPQQKKSEAQRQEDAFMHLHAGAGCRWIYGVVEAFLMCNVVSKRLLKLIVGNARFRSHNSKCDSTSGQNLNR